MPEITYQVELSAREREILVYALTLWRSSHDNLPALEIDALIARLS